MGPGRLSPFYLTLFSCPSPSFGITSGATAGLKLVGESFPWSSGPDWHPSRHAHPGGYSDTDVGRVNACGAVAPGADSNTPEASHFVYTRCVPRSSGGAGHAGHMM